MKKWYVRLGRIAYWGVWPGSWLYLRWSERTRLLLTHKDEILVVNNWLGAGKWNLPGGGLHKGEDPKLGLLRETYEETGLHLRAKDVRHLTSEWYQVHGFRYKCHYFTVSVSDTEPLKHQPYEIVDAAWIKRSQVKAENCGPDVLRALELLDSAQAL